MKKSLISLLCFVPFLLSQNCLAESADSNQPIQIFADKFDGDDVKQVAIYTGNVAIHQGTLEIHGDKLVLSVDPEGYRHGVVTPKGNQLVKFRQRRDQKKPGVEEWMHGQGEKLTYNEKTNQLILTTRAQVSRHENGKLLDESNGIRITYNLTDSTAQVDGNKNMGSQGRVSTVIAPRSERQAAEQNQNSVKLESRRNLGQ